MITMIGRNVNDLYNQAIRRYSIGYSCTPYPSRNGPMLEFNRPVTSVYRKPCERVLFDPVRDANPFFHFFEALWMLIGHNDVAFPAQFAANIANFSDDDKTLNGAYGHRWRRHFQHKLVDSPSGTMGTDHDQLAWAIRRLKADPNDRRVVTQMYDAQVDQDAADNGGKDIPCNTAIFWRLRGGVLDMTVTNRSNDAIWGCYGANAVHFSILHEYVAGCVGAEVGAYYQISNSLHIYTEFPVTKRILGGALPDGYDPYDIREVSVFPMFSGNVSQLDFDADLYMFFNAHRAVYDDYGTPFFKDVVMPMWRAWRAYKRKDSNLFDFVQAIEASDWRRAVREWLVRRGETMT